MMEGHNIKLVLKLSVIYIHMNHSTAGHTNKYIYTIRRL